MSRIIAHKHFVNFKDRAKFSVQSLRGNMRQIEVDLVFSADALAFDTDLENFAGGDVARNEISVGRKLLLEKIPTFVFRYRRRRSCLARFARHPNPAAFAACGLRHQPQLVFTGNRSGMDLDKLAVRILRALLVTSGDSTAGANHRVGRLAINQTWSPGSHDHSVGGKGFQLESPQVHS